MNFQVGERVRVKKNPRGYPNDPGWISPDMDHLKGKIVTIKSVLGSSNYNIKECPKDFTYDKRWFEPICQDWDPKEG